jgi:uncharacterized protein
MKATYPILALLLFSSSLFAQVPADYPASYASAPRFKALIYYTLHAEGQHVDFARQAITFFEKLKFGNGFILDTTQDLAGYPLEKLKQYQLLIMLDGYPNDSTQRKIFEQYMENGGGWMGFHVSGYNDKRTNWPWFRQFLGAGFFYCNCWPPVPAKLVVDLPNHPVTKNLPPSYIAPASEWYQWDPSPRKNKDVQVLLSLSPDNYPIGIKDIIYSGDFPVVWTNTRYRMIYLNMGHGDEVLSDATQRLMVINAFKWVLSTNKNGNPFKK